MAKWILFILLTLLSVVMVFGQWAGYETGNFAGTHALRYQPADIVEVASNEVLSLPPGFAVAKEKTYGAARAVFLIYTA